MQRVKFKRVLQVFVATSLVSELAFSCCHFNKNSGMCWVCNMCLLECRQRGFVPASRPFDITEAEHYSQAKRVLRQKSKYGFSCRTKISRFSLFGGYFKPSRYMVGVSINGSL